MEHVAIEVLGGLLGQKRGLDDISEPSGALSVCGSGSGSGSVDVARMSAGASESLCVVEETSKRVWTPPSSPAGRKMRRTGDCGGAAVGVHPPTPRLERAGGTHSFSSELTVFSDEVHEDATLDGHAMAKWRNYASPCTVPGCACRPWRCEAEGCGMAFAQKNTLKKHIVCVHEKKKAFQCSQCKARFGQSGDLNVHVRTVHDEARPHICPVSSSDGCGATFKLRSHLYKHIRVVHQKLRPHKCDVCETSFAEKNDLRRHQKNVHKLG